MFIPYERLGLVICKLFKSKFLQDFFYNLKVNQNVNYIKNNKPKVIKKLKNKLKSGEKLNAVFYVYDETKWKGQALYDLLKNMYRFDIKHKLFQ